MAKKNEKIVEQVAKKSSGRKDYTDNLGRTWTWDTEAKKYNYVPKAPKLVSQKDFAEAILSVQNEIHDLEAQLETFPNRTKETDQIRSTLRRRDAKVVKLQAQLDALKAASKAKKAVKNSAIQSE